MKLTGRNFLKLLDFSREEIEYLIDYAAELKKEKKSGIEHKLCVGKNIALIFERRAQEPAVPLRWRRTIWA